MKSGTALICTTHLKVREECEEEGGGRHGGGGDEEEDLLARPPHRRQRQERARQTQGQYHLQELHHTRGWPKRGPQVW